MNSICHLLTLLLLLLTGLRGPLGKLAPAYGAQVPTQRSLGLTPPPRAHNPPSGETGGLPPVGAAAKRPAGHGAAAGARAAAVGDRRSAAAAAGRAGGDPRKPLGTGILQGWTPGRGGRVDGSPAGGGIFPFLGGCEAPKKFFDTKSVSPGTP